MLVRRHTDCNCSWLALALLAFHAWQLSTCMHGNSAHASTPEQLAMAILRSGPSLRRACPPTCPVPSLPSGTKQAADPALLGQPGLPQPGGWGTLPSIGCGAATAFQACSKPSRNRGVGSNLSGGRRAVSSSLVRLCHQSRHYRSWCKHCTCTALLTSAASPSKSCRSPTLKAHGGEWAAGAKLPE